jgi:hypothetical protein
MKTSNIMPSSVALTAALMLLPALSANSVTFLGSDPGHQLGASATFDAVGSVLTVTLANTYSGNVVDQAHVLTGIFFSGANGLTPLTAQATGWKWIDGAKTAVNNLNVGAEWQYLSGLSGAPGGATAGISSSGLGLFHAGNFGGAGNNLDGSSYGLLSSGYLGDYQDGLRGRLYLQNSTVFTLSGFSGSLTDIDGVSFQYGTSLSEPNVDGNVVVATVPDHGATALLLGLSMASLIAWKRFPIR